MSFADQNIDNLLKTLVYLITKFSTDFWNFSPIVWYVQDTWRFKFKAEFLILVASTIAGGGGRDGVILP